VTVLKLIAPGRSQRNRVPGRAMPLFKKRWEWEDPHDAFSKSLSQTRYVVIHHAEIVKASINRWRPAWLRLPRSP
jgi:hypothetical protein